MQKERPVKNINTYRDVSRITLEGLAEIHAGFAEFYRDLSARYTSSLQNMAQQDLPEASEQLDAIITSTEQATTNIMDILEEMQVENDNNLGTVNKLIDSCDLDDQVKKPLQDLSSMMASNQQSIMKIFEELSFQDLTGQRIKRIVTLVKSVEGTVQGILKEVGNKIYHEDGPPAAAVTEDKTDGAMDLKGPQKEGQGMDQASIDQLLAEL